MKKYIKSAEEIPVLNQIQAVDTEDMLEDIGFTRLNIPDYSWFGSWEYAGLYGNDIILYDPERRYAIDKNAGKYLDEYFDITDEDSENAFNEAHPDVTTKWVDSIEDILN